MAGGWVRFWTSAEWEKFTPSNPQNHEYFPLLAILLIESKNYPGFRPPFAQFFPFDRASRPPSWVRFFSPRIALQFGFVFSVGFVAQTAIRQIRFAKYAFSSPLPLFSRPNHQTNVPSPNLSVLDLVALQPAESPASAIARSVQTAQHVEKLGYKRYWLAEHHSIQGLACSATPVLIGHIANATHTIRVGSGGVMLPNHAPLIVAEQFGTLAALYPGRIDLGLGRAPGSDRPTMYALRRGLQSTGDDFPELLHELQTYLGPPQPGQQVHAVPGENSNVPITLLGSSDYSAQLAGHLGLPFAFAAHFAPDELLPALHLYRRTFNPSASLKQPYAMVGLPIIVAPTDAEAQRLLTTPQQRFLALIRNQPVELKPPVDSMNGLWSYPEQQAVNGRLRKAIVGSPETVARKLAEFVDQTGVQEILAVTDTYSQSDRLRSYDLLAQVVASLEYVQTATGALAT
jgi:luciferase family oxidoreductase group 1